MTTSLKSIPDHYNSYNEMIDAIHDALRYVDVVKDEREALQLLGTDEDNADFRNNTELKTVRIWDSEMNGEIFYDIVLHECYDDPGSEDYFYYYTITEQ